MNQSYVAPATLNNSTSVTHTSYEDVATHTSYEDVATHASYEDVATHTSYEDVATHTSYEDVATHTSCVSTNGAVGTSKVCSFCNKSFRRRYNLDNHLRIHTKEKPFICNFVCPLGTICNKTFSSPSNLLSHKKLHDEPKYVCKFSYEGKICGKKFCKSIYLTLHMKTHTRENPYVCEMPLCNKKFKRQHDLIRHTRIHTGEKPYVCDVLVPVTPVPVETLQYSTAATTLDIFHINPIKHDIPRVSCDKRFTLACNLAIHKLTHKKRYQCSECKRKFINFDDLIKHKQILDLSSEDKHYICRDILHPIECYTCKICNKTFTKKYNLNRHLSTHNTQKSYICDFVSDTGKICGKSFHVAYYLVKHKLHVHKKNKSKQIKKRISPFKCLQLIHAPRLYLKKLNATPCHTQVLCEEINTTPVKPIIGAFNTNLTHSVTGSIEVGDDSICVGKVICGRVFWSLNQLNNHIKKHANKYKCEICNMNFNTKNILTKHLPVHSLENLYLCKMCGKEFRLLKYLTKHKQYCHVKLPTSTLPQAACVPVKCTHCKLNV